MKQVYMYLGSIGIGRMKLGEILGSMFYVIKRLYELKIKFDLNKLIDVLTDIPTVYQYNKLDEKKFAEAILFKAGVKNFDIYEIFYNYDDKEFYLNDEEITKLEDIEENEHSSENYVLSFTKVSYDSINYIQLRLWKSILFDFKRKYKKIDEKIPYFKVVKVFDKSDIIALYPQTDKIKEKISLFKNDITNLVMYQGLCTKEDISVVFFGDIVVSLNIYL